MTDIGVTTRKRLLAGGATPKQIKHALKDGSLQRLRHGWYASPDADPEVAEVVRNGGVIACHSALARAGIWVPDSRLHVRASRFVDSDLESCRGYGELPIPASPIDPPLLAIACAARCAQLDEFVAICDSFLHQNRRQSLADIARALAPAPSSVRAVLRLIDRRAESGSESLARVRIRSLRVKVRTQVWIAGVGRVDLLVGERLIIEIDSRSHHLGTNYQKDRTRDLIATALGYVVIRLTYEDVVHRWPETRERLLAVLRRDEHRRIPKARGNFHAVPRP